MGNNQDSDKETNQDNNESFILGKIYLGEEDDLEQIIINSYENTKRQNYNLKCNEIKEGECSFFKLLSYLSIVVFQNLFTINIQYDNRCGNQWSGYRRSAAQQYSH